MLVQCINRACASVIMSLFDDVQQKISGSSTISIEVKEILSLMVSVLQTSNHERDLRVTKMEQSIQELRAEAKQNIETLETSLGEKTQATFRNLWDDVNKGFEARDESLSVAKDDLLLLNSEVRKLKNALDEHDAYTRRESLIFSGPALPVFDPNENCVDIARKIIRNDLALPIDPIISTAHRMGPPPAPDATKPDKRDIVVRFCQRDIKYQIYNTARQKKVKGLFANESLTRTRKTILLTLKRMAKDKDTQVEGTMTHNGRVFVFTKPAPNAPSTAKSIRTEINTLDRLESFCNGFVKQPLSKFLKHRV